MKLKLLIIFLVPAICCITACQKQLNDPGNTGGSTINTGNKLKLYIEDATQTSLNEIDSFNVTYDANDRITGLVAQRGSLKYTYNSNNTGYIDTYYGGVLALHETGFLNSSSMLDSTLAYDNTGDTSSAKYIYNGTSLAKLYQYGYDGAGPEIDAIDEYIYDNNGNVLKDIETDGGGNLVLTDTYTYTTYLVNVLITPAFTPLRFKYLPATLTETDATGTTTGSVKYTYQFDSSSRLIKETDTESDGSVIVKTYVYY